jgi:RNA polymerase sigma-70 factor (ECF subfamily)
MPATRDLTANLARDVDAAFPALVDRHLDGIYSGVRRLVPTPADAEDVTQEVFLRAYRALTGYDQQRIATLRLRAWLWTIAVNLCRNAARTRSRRVVAVPIDAAPDPAAADDPAGDALERIADADWRRRLEPLPTPMRTAVVLRHVVGLPYGEIATALDRPVGTVKADVHRGVQRLRTMIEETTS